jgi:hypothetical protein
MQQERHRVIPERIENDLVISTASGGPVNPCRVRAIGGTTRGLGNG